MPDNTAYTIVAPTARAVDDSLKRKSERAHWRILRRAKWMKKKNRQKEERKRGRENTIEKRKCNVRWLVFFLFLLLLLLRLLFLSRPFVLLFNVDAGNNNNVHHHPTSTAKNIAIVLTLKLFEIFFFLVV